MRKNACHPDSRQSPYLFHKVCPVVRNPQPVHSGIHSHVHSYRIAIVRRYFPGIIEIHGCLRQPVIFQLWECIRMGISKNKDLPGYSGPAKPYPLIHGRHAVVLYSGFLQDTGYDNIPVTVSVRLYRRHKRAFPAADSLQLAYVMEQIFPVHLDPRSICPDGSLRLSIFISLTHFRAPPFFCAAGSTSVQAAPQGQTTGSQHL